MTAARTIAGIDVVVWLVAAGWVALYVLAAIAIWLIGAAIAGIPLDRITRHRDQQHDRPEPTPDRPAEQPTRNGTR